MPYDRGSKKDGLANLNTLGECGKCGAPWSRFVSCLSNECVWIEDTTPLVPINFDAWKPTEKAVVIPAGFAPSEPDPAPIAGIPAGFGYLPPVSKADCVGQGAPPAAARGSAAPTLPENTRYTAFRPMVDAAGEVRKLRAAARECDFDQSERATALITRALEIEWSGDEFVIEENCEAF